MAANRNDSYHPDPPPGGRERGRTPALPTLAVACLLSVAGCGGGGGGSPATSTTQPTPTLAVTPTLAPPAPQPPTVTLAPPPAYAISELSAASFGVIGYDPNLAPAGEGVTVLIIDSQLHDSYPLLTEMDVSYPAASTLDCATLTSLADCDDHGSLVASLAGGSHGTVTVVGPAHGSAFESINLDQYLDFFPTDYVVAAENAVKESEAFVVNNSWAYVYRSTLGLDPDRCEDIVSGFDPSGYCSAERIVLVHPFTSQSPFGVEFARELFLDGDVERLGVWAIGNEGFNGETGRICDDELSYCFRVRDVLDTSDHPADDFSEFIQDRLYDRGLYTNINDPELEGYVLAVSALDLYDPGDATLASLGLDYPTVTVSVPTVTHGGTLTTTVVEQVVGLASYSTACGQARRNCLAAPGWGSFRFRGSCPVASDYPSGLCPVSDIKNGPRGTSFAAPIVSAAAALLKSGWPHLTPPGVSTILLTTATDVGAPGVDDEYGHGILNISASFEPLGAVTTSGGVGLGEAKVSAGPAVRHALESSGATFGMADSMGRPYLYHLAGRVSADENSAAESIERMKHESMSLFEAGVHERMGLVGDWAWRDSPGAVGMSAGGWLQRAGIERCLPSCGPHPGQFASALVPSTAVAWSEGGARSALGGRLGLVVEAGLGGAGEELTYRRAGLFHTARAGPALLRLEAGALSESGTFLGSGFGRAFGVSDGEGGYASARVAMPIGEAMGLSASYVAGTSDSSPMANSLVSVVEGAKYDGFRLAAGGEGWELYHSVPVAATSGRMRIDSVGGYSGDGGEWSIVDTPEGVEVLGEISHENWEFREDREWVDLGAAERERVTGLLFGRGVGAGRLSVGAEHVRSSRGAPDLGDEGRFVLTYALGLD